MEAELFLVLINILVKKWKCLIKHLSTLPPPQWGSFKKNAQGLGQSLLNWSTVSLLDENYCEFSIIPLPQESISIDSVSHMTGLREIYYIKWEHQYHKHLKGRAKSFSTSIDKCVFIYRPFYSNINSRRFVEEGFPSLLLAAKRLPSCSSSKFFQLVKTDLGISV